MNLVSSNEAMTIGDWIFSALFGDLGATRRTPAGVTYISGGKSAQ